MDYDKNIQGYKIAFGRLANDENNNFESYLKEKKITILDFLKEVGLNSNLIQPYNYEELKILASGLLECSSFPVITYPKVDDKRDNLNIYNPENAFNIEIDSQMIDFTKSENIIGDEIITKQITFATYTYENNYIHKKIVKISTNHKTKEYNSRIENMAVKAEEVITDLEGHIITEGNYTFSINCPITDYAYAILVEPLNHNSIMPGIYNLLKLVEEEKIKKEYVTINLNISELQKKFQ